MLDKHCCCNLSRVDRRVAYKPGIVFVFLLFLAPRSLLRLFAHHLSRARLAADIKPWYRCSSSCTPLVYHTPEALTDDLKGLLIELDLLFGGEIRRLPPLFEFLYRYYMRRLEHAADTKPPKCPRRLNQGKRHIALPNGDRDCFTCIPVCLEYAFFPFR